MISKIDSPFTARLLITVCAGVAVVAVALTVLLITVERQREIDAAKRYDMVLAQMVEENARLAFDAARAALDDMSAEIAGDDWKRPPSRLAAQSEKWKTINPRIYGLWLLDQDGRALFSSQNGDFQGITFSDRDYFGENAAGTDFAIGGMVKGRASGIWLFFLGKRLTDAQGKFRGVLVATMRADYFTGLYAKLGLNPTDNISIYRTDGTIVARRLQDWSGDVAPSAASQTLFTTSLAKAPAGTVEGLSAIDGIRRIGAYRSVANWPLVVTVLSDARYVLADWQTRAYQYSAFCTAGLLSLACLALWGVRKERALRESSVFLRSLLNNISIPVFVKDVQGRYLGCNPAFANFWGVEESAVIGKTVQDISPTENVSEIIASDVELYTGPGTQVYPRRIVNARGQVCDVIVHKAVFSLASGALGGMVGTLTDVTEKNRFEAALRDSERRNEEERILHLERQRDALVREVHHRIKNHLQGVLGLLRDRMRSTPTLSPLLEPTIHQVSTIAEAYGLQSTGNHSQVTLEQLVTLAAQMHFDGKAVIFHPPGGGGEMVVARDDAVPLALVINELVSNAIKHGGPGGRPVDITLDSGEGTARLRVSNGPASLPGGFSLAGAGSQGRGLELALALLPRDEAWLDIRQEGDSVVAELILSGLEPV